MKRAAEFTTYFSRPLTWMRRWAYWRPRGSRHYRMATASGRALAGRCWIPRRWWVSCSNFAIAPGTATAHRFLSDYEGCMLRATETNIEKQTAIDLYRTM